MLIDLLIIIFTISAVYRGRESGFVRQALAATGFIGGLFAGRWLQPHVLNAARTLEGRALLSLLTILLVATLGLALGEYFGQRLKWRLGNRQANQLDNALGSLLSLVSVLISAWLLASMASNLPLPSVKASVNKSYIISGLNRLLPPAPTVIANLSHLIDPNGFPDVFIGNEPAPHARVNLPSLGAMAAAVQTDQASVVRIRGQGCGGIVSGSGFVVSSGLVATNAHVVAGIERPFVQDANGSHVAAVIWFDPDLDFAILRTSNLSGGPLTIAPSDQPAGTPAAVLGYPGGGDFQADVAAIRGEMTAGGRDIYGNGYSLRDIYEIQADVVPGNSGGPLIGKDGRVLGVVFAASTTYDQVGYALTTPKINSEIHQASGRTQPVSTGQCAE